MILLLGAILLSPHDFNALGQRELARAEAAQRAGVEIIWTGETIEARDEDRQPCGTIEVGKSKDGVTFFRPVELRPSI